MAKFDYRVEATTPHSSLVSLLLVKAALSSTWAMGSSMDDEGNRQKADEELLKFSVHILSLCSIRFGQRAWPGAGNKEIR